jgi:hypothetical protein
MMTFPMVKRNHVPNHQPVQYNVNIFQLIQIGINELIYIYIIGIFQSYINKGYSDHI